MGNKHGFEPRASQHREQSELLLKSQRKVARSLIMIKPTSPPAYVAPIIHATLLKKAGISRHDPVGAQDY
jgi:hypothetical protein